MKIKVRKWLPSNITVSIIFTPKRGKGAYNRRKFKNFRDE
jgi:hypothetical protein